MRRILLALFAVALLVIIALLWWTRSGRSRSAHDDSHQDVATEPESALRPPPVPGVSLQIDEEHEVKAYAGTPLIFSVRMANPDAMDAAAENSANEHAVKEIQAALSAGKIPKDRAESKLSVLRRTQEILPVELGDPSASWEQLVHFALRMPDGKDQPVTWRLKIVNPPETPILTLDARSTAQLDYLLDPEAAGHVTSGDYQIVAVIEVPSDSKVPEDRWHGRAESEPVKLTVLPRPSRLTPAEEENSNLQSARYYLAAKNPQHSLESAQKALLANPKSIPAHILIGEIKEEQGDLPAALEDYQVALTEFDTQYPDSDEATIYLIRKTSDLRDKLTKQTLQKDHSSEH